MKTTIADIQKEYAGQIDQLDLELLITHAIQKSREFVLSHPEYKLPSLRIKNLELKITRRRRDEPLAYILGSREFFGLPFLVSPATLIPRPETELMVEMALEELRSEKPEKIAIIDVGTGSGNIIISIAKTIDNFKFNPPRRINLKFFGTDISVEALKIAKKNATVNNVSEKIKFIHGNLLDKITSISNSIILANLPYLSQKIYDGTLPTVKKYEPKSALYSPQEGLQHYDELLTQIAKLDPINCAVFLEISPEQKMKLPAIIKKYLPTARIEFAKDLAQKWRVCKITL